MAQTISAVIGGSPVEGAPAGRFSSTNPAHLDEVVADVALGDAPLLVAAAQAARQAQRAWAAVPAPVRGRAIAHIGRLVEANKEGLARLVSREIGKPYPEALGEVQEIIDTCDFFLGEGRRLYGQTVPSEMPDKQLFTFRNPVGVVAVITAGNFPVAVPSWYIVPALLCGNAVVWKPAEYSAAAAAAFHELFCRGGGLPPGVFNVVYADGQQTYAGLEEALDAGLVDKVGFTGSTEVGARIGELAGRHLQSACLELGGKNPMVVTANADLDLAVEGALFGGFGTAGQRCTSLGTVICHDSVHDEFLIRFDRATSAAAVGDPFADVLYGPMLDSRFAERFEKYLGWIGPAHKVLGSTGIGRITAANPRAGFVGDPDGRPVLPPDDRGRRAPRRRDLRPGDLRPAGRGDHLPEHGRGHRARQRSWLRAVVSGVHERRAGGVRVPARRLGRHGQREQLHVRGGSAPSVRRQRKVGQWLPPVRRVGARPVHSLAVAQLGLLGQAAEGADGRGGAHARSRVQVVTPAPFMIRR